MDRMELVHAAICEFSLWRLLSRSIGNSFFFFFCFFLFHFSVVLRDSSAGITHTPSMLKRILTHILALSIAQSEASGFTIKLFLILDSLGGGCYCLAQRTIIKPPAAAT